MSYVPFIDIISANANKAPLVRGGIRAYYATGSDGIEETAAQIAAAKAAGMGVILIDQTPSLSVFAAGLADVADIENYAGTPEAAEKAVLDRQGHGWQSTLYSSLDNVPDVKAAFPAKVNQGLILWGVANYAWSIAEAEAYIASHPDCAYCQYGDNITNAGTLVPGTSVTCGEAGCDIDVAAESWAGQFLPAPKPSAVPPKTSATPPKVGTGYRWAASGTESLEQVAASRGTTALVLLKISAENLDPAGFGALNDYVTQKGVDAPMPAGLVYFTVHP
jgi:hypothetical protein